MAKKAPRSKRTVAPDGSTVVLRKNANGEGSIYWDATAERWLIGELSNHLLFGPALKFDGARGRRDVHFWRRLSVGGLACEIQPTQSHDHAEQDRLPRDSDDASNDEQCADTNQQRPQASICCGLHLVGWLWRR